MTINEEKRAGFITLKEASERFGYAPDYLGQLIRKGKIEGKLVYSHVAWVTTPEAIEEYISRENNRSPKKTKKNPKRTDVDELMPQMEDAIFESQISHNVLSETSPLPQTNPNESAFGKFVDARILNDTNARVMLVFLRLLLTLVVVAVIGLFYIFFEATGGELAGLATHSEAHAFELGTVNDQHGTH